MCVSGHAVSEISRNYVFGDKRWAMAPRFTCDLSLERRRTQGYLTEGRLRVDIRKKFFNVRVVRHWNMFSIKVLDVPSLEAFKARLDGTVSNLG